MAPTGTYDISRCLLWNLVPVEMLFVVGQRWSWCWGCAGGYNSRNLIRVSIVT